MITLKLIVSVRLNVMPVFLLIFISLYSSILCSLLSISSHYEGIGLDR
jgi:hypothetical protein